MERGWTNQIMIQINHYIVTLHLRPPKSWNHHIKLLIIQKLQMGKMNHKLIGIWSKWFLIWISTNKKEVWYQIDQNQHYYSSRNQIKKLKSMNSFSRIESKCWIMSKVDYWKRLKRPVLGLKRSRKLNWIMKNDLNSFMMQKWKNKRE